MRTRGRVEWSGVEWSGVEWSGVEWSGVECVECARARVCRGGGGGGNLTYALKWMTISSDFHHIFESTLDGFFRNEKK